MWGEKEKTSVWRFHSNFSRVTINDCGFDCFSQWRVNRLSHRHLNICSMKLETLSDTLLCPHHLQKSLAFGRCSVNIGISNDCLFMYRSLCWLGYCFSTRLSYPLFYYVKYMIMYVIWPSWKSWKGASMCPFAGVLESWWREEGNCFEEVKLAGSGMQVIELEIQESMEGVIRILPDAKPLLQFV